MTTAPVPSSNDPQVAELRRRFADLRRAQGAARLQLILLAIVIVVLFAIFTYSTVSRVRDNFNPPAVQRAVSTRLPEVLPVAGEHLQRATMAALPVYRELATQRLQKIRPELAAKARARLEKIPAETGQMMNTQLQTAFNNAIAKIEPELQKTFPTLTDAQRRDLLNVHFHELIDARNKNIAAHIDRIYTNEMTAMHAALDKFEVPPATDMPGSDLAQRDFLHTMLMLADYELMHGDLFAGAEPAPRPTRSRPTTTAPTTQTAASN